MAFFAVALFAVAFFAVAFFAVALFAVALFAVAFFTVVFLPVALFVGTVCLHSDVSPVLPDDYILKGPSGQGPEDVADKSIRSSCGPASISRDACGSA